MPSDQNIPSQTQLYKVHNEDLHSILAKNKKSVPDFLSQYNMIIMYNVVLVGKMLS